MIIAELSGNHLGDRQMLVEMVELASKAGASFVKIQSFFPDDLSDPWKGRPGVCDRLIKAQMSWADHKFFVNVCEVNGVFPMTTVYTMEYMQRVSESGIRWVKLGSPQATNQTLATAYLAAGFKVIVSTGGTDIVDVPRIPFTAVLHCVSKYPAKVSEANLSRMLAIKARFFKSSYGFSDHTDPLAPGWDMPSKLAMAMGASFIEKHFTILPRGETKDGPVSVDFAQLKELCAFDQKVDKISALPSEYGIFVKGRDDEECQTITDYQSRWKQSF